MNWTATRSRKRSGVSSNHAHALLSRARGQLERSLGALMVARAGRSACADVDAMLAGWDGQLTVPRRKRISRHRERCEVCGERKRRELTSALFAGAFPLVALTPGFRARLQTFTVGRAQHRPLARRPRRAADPEGLAPSKQGVETQAGG